MEEILKFKVIDGEKYVYPNHPMVDCWMFEEDKKEEAMMAYSMAVLAKKNDVSLTELMHLFPAVLRMMKSDGSWKC